MNAPTPVPPIINEHHTISYQITRWDIFFSWMTIIFRSRLLQVFIVVSMIFCVGLSLIPQFRLESASRLLLIAVLDCIGFLVVMVFFQSIMGLASSYLRQHRGVVCRHTLEITEAGLIERTDLNEALHRWPVVCRIFSFGGYLFIYVGENNVHLIPKREFPPEVIGNFEAEVRARSNLKQS